MILTLAEIAEATGGRVVAGDPSATVSSFSNDSRTLQPGALFIALRADRDGHDFVDAAFANGAAAALVVSGALPEGMSHGRDAEHGIVAAGDTAAAVAALGRYARARLGATPVIGITGSTGKTSTKDLTAAALAGLRPAASEASFNNEIGVPLTLLSATDETGVVVAEMGARGIGHIATLCAVARPTVGAITNIGIAHAEFFGSRAEVAVGKGELLEGLPDNGTAVLSADCDMTPGLAARSTAPVLTAGHAAEADVRVSGLVLDSELRPAFRLDTPWGSADVPPLPVRGAHQAVNAAFAVAIAGALGIDPAEAVAGLAGAVGSRWRMELVRTDDGLVVLNDAYNANPSSMTAALQALASINGGERRKVAVLGHMAELGAHSEAEHRQVGRVAAEVGVNTLVVVGAEAAPLGDAAREGGVDVVAVPDSGAALAALAERLRPGDAVLVKASRVVGLERVAAALAAGDWRTS